MVACKATKRSDGWWEKVTSLRTTHGPTPEGGGGGLLWRGKDERGLGDQVNVKCTTRELTGNNKLGGEHQCEGPVIHLANLACHVSVPLPLDSHSSRYTLDVDVMGDASSAHHVPDLPQSTAPRLGVPGTPEFFASVLGFIRTTAPGFPLDPVIFQSIILSVMAGNKHVLLRTREEDIAIVQNLAALVSISIWVSSALFISG